MTSPGPRRWATVQQAAEYLGVHTRTVRRLIARGELPAHHVGSKMVRVDLDEIDATVTGKSHD